MPHSEINKPEYCFAAVNGHYKEMGDNGGFPLAPVQVHGPPPPEVTFGESG